MCDNLELLQDSSAFTFYNTLQFHSNNYHPPQNSEIDETLMPILEREIEVQRACMVFPDHIAL